MTMLLISHDELKKAIAEVEIAFERGFTASEAVLEVINAVESLGRAKHLMLGVNSISPVVVKAHPSDGMLNWGCTEAYKYAQCLNGKLVYDDEDLNAHR